MLKHLVLCPILKDDMLFVDKILGYANESENISSIDIHFLIGFQCVRDYLKYKDIIASKKNVSCVFNLIYLSRLDNWNAICSLVSIGLDVNSFSFLFYGDLLNVSLLAKCCKLPDGVSLLMAKYNIESRTSITKKLSVYFKGRSTEKILYINALMGKLSYAPLQKYIFHRKISMDIQFSGDEYVSDQAMMYKLIKKYGVTYISNETPYYTIVLKNRACKLSVGEMLNQQARLLREIKMLECLFQVCLRTIIKYMLRK